MNKFLTMLKTELKLSFRGMDMIIFAVCMPVVVVILLGIIYGGKPAFDGADYTFLEQSFGAVSTIAVCAGGVMGLPLVISDYRQKKILKRFKITPSSPVLFPDRTGADLSGVCTVIRHEAAGSLPTVYGRIFPCHDLHVQYRNDGRRRVS